MKTSFVQSCLVVMALALGACSQKASTGGVCGSAGLYDTQSNCLSVSSSGNCTMATAQVEGQSIVCWQQSSTNNNNGNGSGGGSGGGGTVTFDPCAPGNPPPAWATTAWTPSSCGPGVTAQTRTVYCPFACACSGAAPASAQTCAGDLSGSNHYSSQCTSAGGSVFTTSDGNKACRFSAGSCPSGWSAMKSSGVAFTQTVSTSYIDVTGCFGSQMTKLTNYHGSMSATAVESASYCTERNFWCTGCKTTATAYSTVTAVLCY